MSVIEGQPTVDPDLAPTPGDQANDEVHAGSVLAHLQHTRDEIVKSETKPLTKIVPRWHGALAIRYQYPEGGSDVIITAVEKAQRTGEASALLDANADVLIACCADVVGRVPGGKWEPIDKMNEAALRIGPRLAGLLGIDVPDNLRSPARHILRHVFSPKAEATGIFEGDLALMAQAGQVIQWLNDGDDRADEKLEGE